MKNEKWKRKKEKKKKRKSWLKLLIKSDNIWGGDLSEK